MKRHSALAPALLVLCASFLCATDASAQMAVTTAAALEGTYGLQATHNGTVYVEDTTPAAETHFLARFWFDANDYLMSTVGSEGDTIRIFQAHDTTTGIAILRIYMVRRLSAGGGQVYRIRTYTRRDDGSMARGENLSLANIPRHIELEWQASSAPGANDGFARLTRLDTGQTRETTGVDNDTYAIDLVRLGIFGGDGSGTIYFDSYESFR